METNVNKYYEQRTSAASGIVSAAVSYHQMHVSDRRRAKLLWGGHLSAKKLNVAEN